MSTTPILSAIVSTYASERLIAGCLESLEAQTVANDIEILVIDSASPQNEGAIVRDFQKRYANIRYIRTPQRETLYQAWNRAIGMARGKYLTSANTDDRHREDAIEKLAGALERDSSAILAYGDAIITLRENETWATAKRLFRFRWPEFSVPKLFQVCYVGPQPVWRRDLHDRHGLFDASFIAAGDYEYWLRVCTSGTFVHVPEPLGLYLASPGSIEHRHPEINWRECEAARERYWRAEWGERPRPHGFYIRVEWNEIYRRLARADFSAIRDAFAHARMLVNGHTERNRQEP